MQIALISFDGLDPRVIYDNRDKLPNFDRMLDNSMHGKWKTPGHTIPSYVGTLTGKEYEVVNFHWDEGRGQYQRHRQTEFDFLWDVCDSSMSLLNMPVLYPPEDIEDAMVAGFLTPDSLVEDNLAKPNQLQRYLNDIGYIHDVNAGATYDELGGEDMLDLMKEMMDRRTVAAQHIIDKYDSDLFYGVYTATDRWFHQCYLHGEDYMPLYEHADMILEDLLSMIPDGVPKIIFSDHGFAHQSGDGGIHKGHMIDGWYSISDAGLPNVRDDSANILDVFPTVLNALGCDIPDGTEGRALINNEEQNQEIKDRLDSQGYL